MMPWIIGYFWTTCWVLVVAIGYDPDRFKKTAVIVALLAWPITLPYMTVRGFFR